MELDRGTRGTDLEFFMELTVEVSSVVVFIVNVNLIFRVASNHHSPIMAYRLVLIPRI